MSDRSWVCAKCGALNSPSEKRCYRCNATRVQVTSSVLGMLRSALGERFPMTVFFVVLSAIVFALSLVSGGNQLGSLFGGMQPWELLRWGAMVSDGRFPSMLAQEEPWRYLSACFIHFGVLHIVLNSFALLDFGRILEERVGSARLAIIFCVTGIAGFVISDVWVSLVTGYTQQPTGGASGAVFGLMGGIIGERLAARDRVWKQHLVHFLVIAAILIIIPLPINNAAHLGGLATGIPLGYLCYRRSEIGDRLSRGLAALLVIASLASIILCQTSETWKQQRRYDETRNM